MTAMERGNANHSNSQCPLCGSRNTVYAFTASDFNWKTQGSFPYDRCRVCGALFIHTGDLLPPAVYPAGYGTFVDTHSPLIKSLVGSPANRKRALLLESRCPPGTLLDIGCGSGFFLAFMRSRGWHVFGLETAPEHIHFARNVLNVKNVLLEAWPPSVHVHRNVQAVSMIHLIEHMTDPLEALRAAHRSLREGGAILIETPNINSWPARFFGRFWVTLDAPRHRVIFSRRSLFRCLEQSGFEKIQITSYSPSTMEWSESFRYMFKYSMTGTFNKTSVSFVARPDLNRDNDPSNTLLKKDALTLLHTAERSAYRIINRMGDLLGSGCNILAVALKH